MGTVFMLVFCGAWYICNGHLCFVFFAIFAGIKNEGALGCIEKGMGLHGT